MSTSTIYSLLSIAVSSVIMVYPESWLLLPLAIGLIFLAVLDWHGN